MQRFFVGISASLLLAAGCISPDVSNLISAGTKLAATASDPAIGDLTADEILAIVNNLPELAAQFPELGIPTSQLAEVPTLTQDQANDAVAFLDQYNIQTVSQLQALIVAAADGEVEVEIPQSLLDFAQALGFETDASKLAPEF